MKIKPISLSSLKVVELLSFLKHLASILEIYPELSPVLKGLVDQLKKRIVEMSMYESDVTFEQETKQVSSLSKRRTESLKAFNNYIETYIYSEDSSLRGAATLVRAPLKENWNELMYKGQKSQTGSILKIDELYKGNKRYVDALAAIKAKEFWDRVIQYDSSYESSYKKRNELITSQKNVTASYIVARNAIAECRKLLQFIQTSYDVENKPEWGEIVGKINVEIDDVMAMLRTRKTLAKKAKESQKDDEKPKI